MRAREFIIQETPVAPALKAAPTAEPANVAQTIKQGTSTGKEMAGNAELSLAATQIPKVPPAWAKAGAKVLPGANIAYQTLDAARRAQGGDYTGSAIAAASAVPVLAIPGMAVQAVRDKYRTGSFLPSDEEIDAAVERDRQQALAKSKE